MSNVSVELNKIFGVKIGTAITNTVNSIADPVIASAETSAAQTPIGAAIVAAVEGAGGKTPGAPVVAGTAASLTLGIADTAFSDVLAAEGVPASVIATLEAAFEAKVTSALAKL